MKSIKSFLQLCRMLYRADSFILITVNYEPDCNAVKVETSMTTGEAIEYMHFVGTSMVEADDAVDVAKQIINP